MEAPEARLHVVCGPPAGGKTWHARRLAGELGAALIDSDTATEGLVQAGLQAAGLSPDDRDSPLYKSHFREPVYEALFALAAENLPHVPVVIAGPFTRECGLPDWPSQLEAHFGVAVCVHFAWAEPVVRRARMVARGAARDRAKLEDWEAHCASCVPGPPRFPHVLVVEHGKVLPQPEGHA